MADGEWEFKECPTCRVKPGSPTLCSSCLHNRNVIANLQAEKKLTGGTKLAKSFEDVGRSPRLDEDGMKTTATITKGPYCLKRPIIEKMIAEARTAVTNAIERLEGGK